MAVICNSRYSTERIDWNAKGGVCEASDIGYRGMGRIYDDACDVGIVLVSLATGKETVWAMSGFDKSGDDIAGWHFVPTPETLRRFPNLAGQTLLVIND